jgi:TRAP-type mannitol/chloroaromatic compound transport system permease large subunit
MFMDQVSMMLITIPFYFPLAKVAGIDPIWLGIMMLVAMEVSLLTPPFGILLFVMKGVAPKSINFQDIVRAALPFVILELTILGLIISFPGTVTWLPSQIR